MSTREEQQEAQSREENCASFVAGGPSARLPGGEGEEGERIRLNPAAKRGGRPETISCKLPADSLHAATGIAGSGQGLAGRRQGVGWREQHRQSLLAHLGTYRIETGTAQQRTIQPG